jgi:cell division protease FtsH
MSDKLGMVQLEKDNGPQYGQPLYSDTTSRLIDEEVRHITTQGYETACDIILRYKDRHEAIAQALLEYETLDEKQILSLFNTGKMPENENEAKKDDGTPMSYEQAKQAANDKLTEDEEEAASSEETTTSDDDDKA